MGVNSTKSEVPVIFCACGCGKQLDALDKYGRKRIYISGHNNRKYKDPLQYKSEWEKRNKKYMKEYRAKWKKLTGRKRKLELINKAGGICTRCGLSFNGVNECCFDFHHRNPLTKEFSLNRRTMCSFSWERILVEFEKCSLLCANCHRQVHWEMEFIKSSEEGWFDDMGEG